MRLALVLAKRFLVMASMDGKPERRLGSLGRAAVRWVLRHWIRHDELVRIRQQIRYLAYAELCRRVDQDPDLSLYELSIFSQNGEDGVLQEIFRRIGVDSRRFFEIGASANEANAVLLADVFGWSGVFCDSSPEEGSELSAKYQNSERVRVLNVHVTPNNISDLISACTDGGSLDLLSIDVDGNDYWLWQSVGACNARVVVIEYNSSLGGARVVHPYQDTRWDGSSDTGSSLRSLMELGESLGYELVHAESTGVNLFFVRRDLIPAGAFSASISVVPRVPNYFLYGLRHPESPR